MRFQRIARPAFVVLLLCTALFAQLARTEPAPDVKVHSNAPKEVIDWLRTAAIPLQTTSPDSGLNDMSPLASVVGDARIVAMGEATHGTREFFQMKHRMLEFLVERMGFTVFAIEANWPESLAVNEYVLNGKGDPAEALAGMYFWTWNTEEVLDMIRWMRKYNENPAHIKKVEFCGFDMQVARVAVSNVEDYLQKVDASGSATAERLLAPLADETSERSYAHKPIRFRQQTADGIKVLLARFDDRKHVYITASSEREWRLARHSLEIVKQAEELYSTKTPGVRDRDMAENVKWILDNEPAGTKVMLWAHNGHVWTGTEHSEPMGKVLRQIYGQEMVVCGFSFYQGSFRAVPQPLLPDHYRNTFLVMPASADTLDAALAATEFPLFAVDLRRAPAGGVRDWLNASHPMRTIGATYYEFNPSAFFSPIPPNSFDVIFFVNRTSPSRENPPLPKQMETDFEQG